MCKVFKIIKLCFFEPLLKGKARKNSTEYDFNLISMLNFLDIKMVLKKILKNIKKSVALKLTLR